MHPAVQPPASADYARLAPDRERWKTPRGELTIWQPSDTVVVFELGGHIGRAFVEPIIERVQGLVDAGGRPTVFDNLERAVSYDGDVRLEITRFAARTAADVAATHVLVRSKLIAMTVAVANLALRQALTVHSSRSGFDEALSRAMVQG